MEEEESKCNLKVICGFTCSSVENVTLVLSSGRLSPTLLLLFF